MNHCIRAAFVAVVAGAVLAVTPGLVAAPAQAAVSITLNPPSSTTIRQVPVFPNASDVRAQSAYGLSLGNVDTSKPVKVAVAVSPVTGGPRYLQIQKVAAGALPVASTSAWVAPPLAASINGAVGATLATSPAGTEHYYLAAQGTGTYTVVFYQEGSTDDGVYTPADDSSASTITLTSWDIYPPQQDSADGRPWSVTSTPSVIQPGGQVSTTIALPPISTIDIRGRIGNGDNRGVLGAILAGSDGRNGSVTLTYTVPGQGAVPGTLTYNGLSVDGNGDSYPTYTASSGPVNTVGLLSATGKVGFGYTRKTSDTIVGAPMTLTATPKVLVGTRTYLKGTADPNTKVDIYYQSVLNAIPPGKPRLIGSRVTNPDGTWEAGTTIGSSGTYTALINRKSASAAATTYTRVTAKAKALGDGKVRFTANGTPSLIGYINVYENGQRIGHARTDKYGDAVVVVQSTPGRRTFDVYFAVPGSDPGSVSITGTVS